MPKFGALGKFFGRTVSDSAGFAAGVAVAPTLAPGLEKLRQETWARAPFRLPEVGTLASGVSQGQVPIDQAYSWALAHGFDKKAFDALVNVANTGPGVPTAFDLWRRGVIDEKGFRRAAQRQGLEAEWINDLVKIKLEVLDPGQLAAAIHRGLVPDPGLLQGQQPGNDRTVPAYPVYQIDALAEALANGYDPDHLGVLVGLQGLPMGVIEAANAYYRGIITHDDYIAAFNESNSRNEWAAAVLEYARQIPTARDFMENALRGHHDFDWAAEQAARHGMSRDDAFLIYQNQGRPLNLHQITQALAWGANYNPGEGDNPDPWMQAVLLGAVRPEYYEMQDALKYNLPSAMYFRALQQARVLTQEQAQTWYLRLGWPPELAEQVSKAFDKQKASAEKEATAADWLTLYDGGHATEAQTLAALQDLGYPLDEAQRKVELIGARRVASAKGTAITDLHASYKKGEIDATSAQHAIESLGVTTADASSIVTAWSAWYAAIAENQTQ